jgi:hypothetical protein
MRPARNDADIGACLKQPDRQLAADRARAEDGEFHPVIP